MESSQEAPRRAIVLFTDEPQAGFGASQLLTSTGKFEVQAPGSDVSRLLPLVKQFQPDVILLDVTPDMTVSLFSAIRDAAPESRLILWARQLPSELMAQAAELGASVLRRTCSNQQFIDTLLAAADGGELCDEPVDEDRTTRVRLTPRESQLVSLLAQGLKNKEIASCLGISEGTVKIYLSKLFQKSGARDRFELSLFGLKNVYCGHAFWDGPNSFVTGREEDRARPFLRSLVLVQPVRRAGCPEMPQAAGQ